MVKTMRCPWVLKTGCWPLRETKAGDENMDVDRIVEGERETLESRTCGQSLLEHPYTYILGAREGMRRKAKRKVSKEGDKQEVTAAS